MRLNSVEYVIFEMNIWRKIQGATAETEKKTNEKEMTDPVIVRADKSLLVPAFIRLCRVLNP